MKENIEQSLNLLADKIGVHPGLLWHTLLEQAKVSATKSVVIAILTAIFGCVLYKLHLKFTERGGDMWNTYETYQGYAIVPMVMSFSVFCILVLHFMFFGITDIYTGYFYPEYWATEKVLRMFDCE